VSISFRLSDNWEGQRNVYGKEVAAHSGDSLAGIIVSWYVIPLKAILMEYLYRKPKVLPRSVLLSTCKDVSTDLTCIAHPMYIDMANLPGGQLSLAHFRF
jgi:hypothetical protein